MSLYPFLRSPFTDVTAFMLNAQQNPNSMCAKLEMRFYDCIEAYGVNGVKDKCKDLVEDLRECSLHLKEEARARRMRLERERQYLMGERKKHYEEAPPMNSY